VAHEVLQHELARRQAEARALAERLADMRRRVSQTAIGYERAGDSRHPRMDEFREAIRSRDVIGQAKGILMTTGLSADEAFDLLKRTSQLANRRLREIAEELVAKATSPSTPGDEPLERARRASLAMDHHRGALAALATERAEAVMEALQTGMSRSEVARELGVTPQAVTKLMKRLPAITSGSVSSST
jgi:hypothetical protein